MSPELMSISLRSVLVRISMSPELMSISLRSVSLLHRWQKEKEEKCKKEKKIVLVAAYRRMLVAVLWVLVLSLLAKCLHVWPFI